MRTCTLMKINWCCSNHTPPNQLTPPLTIGVCPPTPILVEQLHAIPLLAAGPTLPIVITLAVGFKTNTHKISPNAITLLLTTVPLLCITPLLIVVLPSLELHVYENVICPPLNLVITQVPPSP